jgi:hypothetical protein
MSPRNEDTLRLHLISRHDALKITVLVLAPLRMLGHRLKFIPQYCTLDEKGVIRSEPCSEGLEEVQYSQSHEKGIKKPSECIKHLKSSIG